MEVRCWSRINVLVLAALATMKWFDWRCIRAAGLWRAGPSVRSAVVPAALIGLSLQYRGALGSGGIALAGLAYWALRGKRATIAKL